MLILPHRRSSLWWGRGVPTVPVTVDRSHPLSSGLIGCYVPGCQAQYNDLTGIGPTLTPDSTSGFIDNTRTQEGYGYSCNAVNASLFSGAFPASWQITTGATLFWCGSWPNAFIANTANVVLWGNIQSPSADPPSSCYAIGISFFSGCVAFLYSTGDTAQILDPGTQFLDTETTIAISFKVGGAINIYMWDRTGLTASSGIWSGAAPDYTLAPQPCIGVDPVMDPTDFSGTVTAAAYLYDYPMSLPQITQLYRAPFSILAPAARTTHGPFLSYSGNPFRRWNRTYLIR